MSKNKKWTKSRHRVVRNIADVLMRPYMKAKYGIRIDPFEKQGDRHGNEPERDPDAVGRPADQNDGV